MSIADVQTIPSRLRWVRVQRGMSSRQWADRITAEGGYEITNPTVLSYEKQGAKIPAEYIAVVADVLGLRPEWLLTGGGRPDQPVGRREPIDVTENELELRVGDAVRSVSISVNQYTVQEPALRFGELELPFRSGIDHEFRAVVDGSFFSYGEEWEPVEAALQQIGAKKVDGAEPGATAYELASCRISQFPAYWKWEHNATWQYYLEEVDEEAEYAGRLMDKLELEVLPHSIFNGSLLLIRSLKVHKQVRGWEIGAKLLGHALWRLHTEDGEIAMALVDHDNFDPDYPTSRAQLRMLSVRNELFERAGFRTVAHAGLIDESVQLKVFYAVLGEDLEGNSTPLNYRGLGRLGYWRNSRSKASSVESVSDSAMDEAVENDT